MDQAAVHFDGKFEVELKYRLTSKSRFLENISSIAHEVMLLDNLESDCYFDTQDQKLFLSGKSLCIREMEPSGIKLWIVKGPDADRCEATNISDANKAKSMLSTMGYQLVLSMHKTRSIYFVGKFHITLDHIEGLGDFAEFAIMTNDESLLEKYRLELITLSSKFGLSQTELEHNSYKTLYCNMLTRSRKNK